MVTNSDRLLQNLREYAEQPHDVAGEQSDIKEAADLIERLAAERDAANNRIAALEYELKKFKAVLWASQDDKAECEYDLQVTKNQRKKLEAELHETQQALFREAMQRDELVVALQKARPIVMASVSGVALAKPSDLEALDSALAKLEKENE